MAGWHHQLNGREFEQTPGDSEGRKDDVVQSTGSQRVGPERRLSAEELMLLNCGAGKDS